MSHSTLEGALRSALEDHGHHEGREEGAVPPRLAAALDHAVFPGGARVRPQLCLAVARAWGAHAPGELTLAAAAAVELLHCASLVHDDLPCFDDAAERRGRPSVHAAFGEATAVLVGDALIVKSFEVLAHALRRRHEVGLEPLLLLAGAAGSRGGLVAGQAWELEPTADLGRYHRAKTASLFELAAVLGALTSGRPVDAEALRAARSLGTAFGVAYQIADDVADRLSDPAVLGKPTGKDAELGRPTAASGPVEEVMVRFDRAVRGAVAAVPACPGEEDLKAFVEAVFAALAARAGADMTLAGPLREGYPRRSNGQVPDARRHLPRRHQDVPG